MESRQKRKRPNKNNQPAPTATAAKPIPAMDAIRAAPHNFWALIKADSEKARVAGTTTEQRAKSMAEAAAEIKGLCPPADIEAIKRRLDDISQRIDKSSGTQSTSYVAMIALTAVSVGSIINNMVASGLYDLLKQHWASVLTVFMSEGAVSEDQELAIKNYQRVTERFPPKILADSTILPNLDAVGYRFFYLEIRSNPEMQRLLASLSPMPARALRRHIFMMLWRDIAQDGQLRGS